MTLDDRARRAALAVHEVVATRVDTTQRLRELHARAAQTESASQSRQRTGRDRRRQVLAFVAAFVVIALIVGSIIVIQRVGRETATSGSAPVTGSAIYSYVADELPAGFTATEYEVFDQSTGQSPAGFRVPLARSIVFEAPQRNAKPLILAAMINRLPGIPPFADGTPDGVAPVVDASSGLPSMSWERAPGWEIKVSGNVGDAALLAFAHSVHIPTDINATPSQVEVPKPPSRYAKVLDEAAKEPRAGSTTTNRGITYSTSYRSVPNLSVGTTTPDTNVHTDIAHLALLKIHGHKAILTSTKDRYGNTIYSLDWHQHGHSIGVESTGLSRAQLLAAAVSVHAVDHSHWDRAVAHARTDPLIGAGALNYFTQFGPNAPPATIVTTYDEPNWTYTLSLNSFTTNGTDWLCARFSRGSGGSIECTDPDTGFAIPTFVGEANYPSIIMGSIGRSVATVEIALADGRTINATFYDTGRGSAPRIFYANLGHDPPAGTLTIRDHNGREQHVHFNALPPSPPDTPPPATP